MGMSKSIIVIKGNHLNNLQAIVELLNYTEDEALFEELSQTTVFENDWTIIVDEEMVYFEEEDLLSEIAEEINAEIFTFVIQSTSATYGFSYFSKDKSRIFFVQDLEIIEDSGEKLEVENELSITANISDTDIVNMTDRLGIRFAE